MRKYERKIINVNKSDFRAVLTSAVLMLLGVVLGNSASGFISADKLQEVFAALQGFFESKNSIEIDKTTLFFASLKEYTFSFILILVCSFSVWFVPIIFIKLLTDGFYTGLSSGMIVRLFGVKGFLNSAVWLFLKNSIYIPCLIILAVYFAKSAIRCHRIRKKKDIRKVICEIIIVLLVAILCSFMASYVITWAVLCLR